MRKRLEVGDVIEFTLYGQSSVIKKGDRAVIKKIVERGEDWTHVYYLRDGKKMSRQAFLYDKGFEIVGKNQPITHAELQAAPSLPSVEELENFIFKR